MIEPGADGQGPNQDALGTAADADITFRTLDGVQVGDVQEDGSADLSVRAASMAEPAASATNESPGTNADQNQSDSELLIGPELQAALAKVAQMQAFCREQLSSMMRTEATNKLIRAMRSLTNIDRPTANTSEQNAANYLNELASRVGEFINEANSYLRSFRPVPRFAQAFSSQTEWQNPLNINRPLYEQARLLRAKAEREEAAKAVPAVELTDAEQKRALYVQVCQEFTDGRRMEERGSIPLNGPQQMALRELARQVVNQAVFQTESGRSEDEANKSTRRQLAIDAINQVVEGQKKVERPDQWPHAGKIRLVAQLMTELLTSKYASDPAVARDAGIRLGGLVDAVRAIGDPGSKAVDLAYTEANTIFQLYASQRVEQMQTTSGVATGT